LESATSEVACVIVKSGCRHCGLPGMYGSESDLEQNAGSIQLHWILFFALQHVRMPFSQETRRYGFRAKGATWGRNNGKRKNGRNTLMSC
jgi:hypothetical protein